jgi:hypothetical protein
MSFSRANRGSSATLERTAQLALEQIELLELRQRRVEAMNRAAWYDGSPRAIGAPGSGPELSVVDGIRFLKAAGVIG